MSHITLRGKYMKAINTQLLNEIEDAKIRQLRMAYWGGKEKGPPTVIRFGLQRQRAFRSSSYDLDLKPEEARINFIDVEWVSAVLVGSKPLTIPTRPYLISSIRGVPGPLS